jgi:hypothetical protein
MPLCPHRMPADARILVSLAGLRCFLILDLHCGLRSPSIADVILFRYHHVWDDNTPYEYNLPYLQRKVYPYSG